ncbi:MAG: alpha/beta hydrolase [Solobacterium sp.]|nr:alpha/beta hydrolase [Solobacterium sp.]
MKTENITIGREFPLEGILTLPENTDAPVPACVLVHGSGSSDKDEKIFELRPFADIANELALHGVASLRYDKRSFVHGRQMVKSKTPITVYEETIEDAVFAADLLRNDPRIDHDRIFIIGHSMGAMLSGRIDAEGGNFKGLIMMAGIPFSLDEVLMRQLQELADTSNFIVRTIISKQKEKLAKQFAAMDSMSDEDAQKIRMGGGTTLYYFKDIKQHPVRDYLLANKKPLLIMQGEKDFQVRADLDYAAFQEILKDRKNVTWRLYPDLNHLFMKSVYGTIKEANKEYKVKQHIPREVIADIAEWIHSVQ